LHGTHAGVACSTPGRNHAASTLFAGGHPVPGRAVTVGQARSSETRQGGASSPGEDEGGASEDDRATRSPNDGGGCSVPDAPRKAAEFAALTVLVRSAQRML
jgi:hypothetical protein